MGPPKMVGTARDQLGAGAGAERTSEGGGRNIHVCKCRDNNGDNRYGDIRIRKGNGGGGVTGGQWLQWGGMERGGRLRTTLFQRSEIHGEINVAN